MTAAAVETTPIAAAAVPLAAARRVLAWRGVPLAARADVYTTADADGDEQSRLRNCARRERRGSRYSGLFRSEQRAQNACVFAHGVRVCA